MTDLTVKTFNEGTIASIILVAMAKARLGWHSEPDPEIAKDLIFASEKLMKTFVGCCETVKKKLDEPVPDAPAIARIIMAACAYSHNHPVKEIESEEFAKQVKAYAASMENRKCITALSVLLVTWHKRGSMTVDELIKLSDEIRSAIHAIEK